LADSIISPLFNNDNVTNEVSALHSEHLIRNAYSEEVEYRMRQLSLGADHAVAKYLRGSGQSLVFAAKKMNATLASELENFFRDCYSSNLMSLAVTGPQSLNELSEMVGPSFSEVNNRFLFSLRVY
jgi:insulysin